MRKLRSVVLSSVRQARIRELIAERRRPGYWFARKAT
jgi:hypothetical protein